MLFALVTLLAASEKVQAKGMMLSNAFIHSLHAFQSADQLRCSRHSMAALQPALSWDFLHHVIESMESHMDESYVLHPPLKCQHARSAPCVPSVAFWAGGAGP